MWLLTREKGVGAGRERERSDDREELAGHRSKGVPRNGFMGNVVECSTVVSGMED